MSPHLYWIKGKNLTYVRRKTEETSLEGRLEALWDSRYLVAIVTI